MGLIEVTFLVFLVLKLTSVIDWSWWWVTAPLWIGYGVALVVWIIVTATGAVGMRSATRSFRRDLNRL